jgi:S-adenosylmethionine:tRNA ribosyltransferase-isomerase
MKTSDFDYVLPPELIAQHPVEPRDASRLLVVDRRSGALEHRAFRDLPSYLRPGDLLVGNDSRVIPARLHGVKATGGAVEIFLLRPAPGEHPAAWECLVGGKGLRPGAEVAVDDPTGRHEVHARIVNETEAGGRVVFFDPPVDEWLWDVGKVPLPTYIHSELEDAERYQTVYSRIEGSVASSTAGLHFTPEMLLSLRAMDVNLAFVTLHIGLDTFRPVQAEEVEHHQIHREWAEISPETARAANETRLAGGRVIAIGTTAVRVLESAAKIALGFRPCDDVPAGSICGWQTVAAFRGETDLFIKPGHRFRAVDVMVTNFHLPRSTLLMLVSAFAGKELIDRAYEAAIRERYRFYSFGDAMLIL